MAFVVPGIQGKPVHANNFTGRMRRNPRLATWFTLAEAASFADGTAHRMIPRKGALLAAHGLAGSPAWAAAAGVDDFRFASITGGNYWSTPNQFLNDGAGFGATIVMQPTDGYVEPMAMTFNDGSLIYVKPNHAGASGVTWRSAGVDSNVAGLGAIGALGSISLLNFSYRFSDRRVSWQVNHGEIVTATAPEAWAPLASLTSLGLVMGRAFAAQPYLGILLDVAMWKADFLGNEDDIDLVSEYVSTAYGV